MKEIRAKSRRRLFLQIRWQCTQFSCRQRDFYYYVAYIYYFFNLHFAQKSQPSQANRGWRWSDIQKPTNWLNVTLQMQCLCNCKFHVQLAAHFLWMTVTSTICSLEELLRRRPHNVRPCLEISQWGRFVFKSCTANLKAKTEKCKLVIAPTSHRSEFRLLPVQRDL